MKKTDSTLQRGFTLVEMLVVIGIIGILATALISSFSHVKMIALQSQAQSLVSEAATAFTVYLQKERKWPDEWVNENGKGSKKEMDEEVCWIFQNARLLDLTTYKRNSDGSVKERKETNINPESLDRFGMLDPWGRNALKKSSTNSKTSAVASGGTFEDHRLQFCLDTNYDGFVDSSDENPPPDGVKVRASAIVWSRGPSGDKSFDRTGKLTKDIRTSWPFGTARK